MARNWAGELTQAIFGVRVEAVEDTFFLRYTLSDTQLTLKCFLKLTLSRTFWGMVLFNG